MRRANAADVWPARLEGHGGPVKGIAVAPSGRSVTTASFDYSVILRSWPEGREKAIFYGHDAAANAAIFTPDGARVVTAGDDGKVLVWSVDGPSERHAVEVELGRHQGKVLHLAISPDGRTVASASWDGRVGLWSLDPSGAIGFLDGHDGPVNDVAFGADGTRLYSAGYDGTIRLWSVSERRELHKVVRHGFGVNVLAVDEAAGRLAYGALDGGIRIVGLDDGVVQATIEHDRTPILAVAAAADGQRFAFGDGSGVVTIVDAALGRVTQDFPAARGPIWALAFGPGDTTLLVGGLDSSVAVWPLDPLRRPDGDNGYTKASEPRSNGERQFMRKCQICHTLTPDTARRAGPTLHGLFGRPAGTVPGYPYSQTLTSLGIVWDEHTIDALFAEGPDHYIPGSKMPLQKMANGRDRADLIEYLKEATR
ncbi:MAG: hypothetical protein HQ481_00070 [Alphaproteobacteria bacterium]|nr:hypothetical protein [Alphaproteobacteria bacterium]